jgi:hypothetical protein
LIATLGPVFKGTLRPTPASPPALPSPNHEPVPLETGTSCLTKGAQYSRNVKEQFGMLRLGFAVRQTNATAD